MIRTTEELEQNGKRVVCYRSSDKDPQRCIGADCMAWRFATEPRRRFFVAQDDEAKVEPERPSSVPPSWTFEPSDGDRAGWLEPEAEAVRRARGYCGLAGMPTEVANSRAVWILDRFLERVSP